MVFRRSGTPASALVGRLGIGQVLTQASVFVLGLEQFVGDVQGRHDGDPFGPDDASRFPDLAHSFVQETRRDQEVMHFVFGTGNGILLAEKMHFDRALFAHGTLRFSCQGLFGMITVSR